ncbi:MAG TPA: aminodeoxychorismate lyase [Steroidobacteraceae bacterium]|nr:aminodeoxychorismate lyase [Steroidobacteraceae bacterium]
MSSWINGRASTAIDHRDRGLQYGDGVFETMRVGQGRIRLLDYHLERLYEGCRRLNIRAPDAGKLERELVMHAASRADAVLKLIVTRGIGPRGYRSSGQERCTRVISLHALPRSVARAALEPKHLRMCRTQLGTNPALAGLKTLNRLESVVARAEWRDARVWDGLMRDIEGNVISGTMSNFFIKRGPFLLTPMLDRCGVAGVMRRWVLEQAGSLGLRPLEGRLRWEEIGEAEEAFVTNAVAGIVPIAVIQQGRDRVAFRHTEISARLHARLELL